jgi:hypothetical protein
MTREGEAETREKEGPGSMLFISSLIRSQKFYLKNKRKKSRRESKDRLVLVSLIGSERCGHSFGPFEGFFDVVVDELGAAVVVVGCSDDVAAVVHSH